MSVIHTELKRAEPAATWFLKIANGSVYGPVETTMLCQWARDGRISQGSEISRDQRNWFPAEDLEDLDMRWIAQLPDGEVLGPFNIKAAPHLFEMGELPRETRLIEQHTGRSMLIQDLVPTTPDANSATRRTSATAGGRKPAAPAPAKEPAPRPPAAAAAPAPAPKPAPERPRPAPAPAAPVVDRPRPTETKAKPSAPSAGERTAPAAPRVPRPAPAAEPAASRPARHPATPAEPDRTALRALEQRAEQAEAELKAYRQQVVQNEESLLERLHHAEDAVRKHQDELEDLRRQYEAIGNDRDRIQEELSAHVIQAQDLKQSSSQSAHTLESRLRELEHEHAALRDQAASARQELAHAKAQLQELRLHYEPLQKESMRNYELLERYTAELDEERRRHAESVHALNGELEGARAENAQLRDRLAERSRPRPTGRATETTAPAQRSEPPTPTPAAPVLGSLFKAADRIGATVAEPGESRRKAALLHKLKVVGPIAAGGLLLLVILIRLIVGCGAARPVPPPAGHTGLTQPPAAGGTQPSAAMPTFDLPPMTVAATGEDGAPQLTPEWPRFNVARVQVSYLPAECVVRFEFGLFSALTQFTAGAEDTLALLAEQLRDQTDRFRISVEGHTDPTPVAGSVSYASNYALGMARANAVIRLLVDRFGLPEAAFAAASAGDSAPPFPNTATERSKNRTVVLHIRMK